MARPLKSSYIGNLPRLHREILVAVTYWPTPARIALELGIDNKRAADILGRLARDGLVRRVFWGVYALTEAGLVELSE